jgi:hypothetical protein
LEGAPRTAVNAVKRTNEAGNIFGKKKFKYLKKVSKKKSSRQKDSGPENRKRGKEENGERRGPFTYKPSLGSVTTFDADHKQHTETSQIASPRMRQATLQVSESSSSLEESF